MRKIDGSLRVRLGAMALAVIAAGMLVVGGCAMSSAPAGDPTTRAQSDPWNYAPNSEDYDIYGGGLTDFHKDAFNRDMNHVLNP